MAPGYARIELNEKSDAVFDRDETHPLIGVWGVVVFAATLLAIGWLAGDWHVIPNGFWSMLHHIFGI